MNAGAEGEGKVVIPMFLLRGSRSMVVPQKDKRKSTFKEKDDKMSFEKVEFEITEIS